MPKQNANPLLEAYITEKEAEQEEKVQNWAHQVRLMYNSFRKEGFTAQQSMKLTKYWWRRVDVMSYWRDKDKEKDKDGS